MSLTTVGDPGTWCHAELDEHNLLEDLGPSSSDHWSGLDDLLRPDPSAAPADRGRLIEAVEVLESDIAGAPGRVRAHHLVSPVLDLWAMAGDVDTETTGQLETLLGRLTGVTRVSPGVVRASLAEVRHHLYEGKPGGR